MRVVVVVRARFKGQTAEQRRRDHDGVFTREAVARFQLAGNFSHQAFVSPEDEKEVVAIDMWDRPTLDDVTGFYRDKAFQEAAGATVEQVHDLRFYVDSGWSRY